LPYPNVNFRPKKPVFGRGKVSNVIETKHFPNAPLS
jgi:hypothetical protein